MKTQAIIFDKDGTLLDFDLLWLPISYKAIEDVLVAVKQKPDLTDEMLSVLGVKNNITSINGVLCKGTYNQMGQAIYKVLEKYRCDITEEEAVRLTIDAYHRNSEVGMVKPACENIFDVLSKLKQLGIKLAVVTTDDAVVTKRCLETLGIDTLFDVVYTDDGKYPAKPDAYCIHDFCKKTGLSKSEVVMVGDTLTDVCFARNGGIKIIGVAKSNENRCILEKQADVVIPDISHVLEVIE
ncbi:MAG: HAD family hydrolase [Lachnospiraceae bacterium]|nr:HAD family hydrolase [Lachnospiraceae bacterium]